MDERDNELIGQGMVGMLTHVFDWIDDDHLDDLRRLLRDESGWWPGDTPGSTLSRRYLLDRTCRRLVALGVAPAKYYVGCGDMFPAAPDDASGLDDLDDPGQGGDPGADGSES